MLKFSDMKCKEYEYKRKEILYWWFCWIIKSKTHEYAERRVSLTWNCIRNQEIFSETTTSEALSVYGMKENLNRTKIMLKDLNVWSQNSPFLQEKLYLDKRVETPPGEWNYQEKPINGGKLNQEKHYLEDSRRIRETTGESKRGRKRKTRATIWKKRKSLDKLNLQSTDRISP
jgi:hypothetical protein